MGIRNAAKALLLHEGKILVNKNRNTLGAMCYGLENGAIYYDLPGGGQNQYETLEEAVRRECLEEAGYTVHVERLGAIYEEISINAELRTHYEMYAHKVYFLFVCHLEDVPRKAVTELDLDMLCSEWVDVEEVKNLPIYPEVLRTELNEILGAKMPLFLGSRRINQP
ncbi:MAG TPA: NUDIX domain-containing protein [Clostridia bacterium]|nr:NUDIX domain-containing protein [Clostridia bacterium]